jgi:serine/threonine protein kinase
MSDFGVVDHLNVASNSPYLAPEVSEKGDFGPAADWWSLGAILHLVKFGVPPLIRDSQRSQVSCDDEMSSLISLLLSRDRKRRRRFDRIKTHRFFKEVDWEAVIGKKVIASAREHHELAGKSENEVPEPPVAFYNEFMYLELCSSGFHG